MRKYVIILSVIFGIVCIIFFSDYTVFASEMYPTPTFVYEWYLGIGEFNTPVDLSSDGYVYVADRYNHRIQKFDTDGNFILQWGSYGSGNGEFKTIFDVAVGPDGSVYVTDHLNYRIQKFDGDGNYIMQWGSLGTDKGEFYLPSGIAVDDAGFVYVADTYNFRVQKFDSNGNYVRKYSIAYACGVAIGPDGSIYASDWYNRRIRKFDSAGNIVKTWWVPTGCGIDVDADGYVYEADRRNDRIRKYDENGNFISEWGSTGSGDGQFRAPTGVSIGTDGSIYVSEHLNQRIQKFDSDGSYITQWGDFYTTKTSLWVGLTEENYLYIADTQNHNLQKFDGDGNFVDEIGALGSGDGQFNGPEGVAVSADGSFYVADFFNNRIQKFDSNGSYLGQWGSYGSGNGEFDRPLAVAVDGDGSIYIVDWGNDRIQKFNSSGNYLTQWEVLSPYDIAVSDDKLIYITSDKNHRVEQFDGNGNFLLSWGILGSGDGEFNNPKGITVSDDGSVYVVDSGNHRIQIFGSAGNYIGEWGSYGHSEGQFKSPHDIAISNDGFIYVTDAHSSRIQKFSVNNPPIANADGPYSVEEGGNVSLVGSGTDPDNDPLTFSWDLDNDATFETSGKNVTFSAIGLDGPSTQTVAVQVCDSSIACDTDEATINILNVAPTVEAITAPSDPVLVNSEVSVNTNFTDPGVLDTHTAIWYWGDRSTSTGSVEETNGSGFVSGSYIYTTPGVYTLRVTVTDKDGDIGESIFEYVVIYDPEGGFVTGGGWLDSPAGAYVPDPLLSGKATFGFISKYKKGASVPTGNTEFQFQVADLNFKSTSYEWLVVTGSDYAKFKGQGTINGELAPNGEKYKFKLWAGDGYDEGADTFRIKIWWEDGDGEYVVYDNGMDQPISGGSIVVHDK